MTGGPWAETGLASAPPLRGSTPKLCVGKGAGDSHILTPHTGGDPQVYTVLDPLQILSPLLSSSSISKPRMNSYPRSSLSFQLQTPISNAGKCVFMPSISNVHVHVHVHAMSLPQDDPQFKAFAASGISASQHSILLVKVHLAHSNSYKQLLL